VNPALTLVCPWVSGDRLLDRILDRHDVLAGIDELAQRRVQRRCLAASGGAGDQDDPLVAVDQCAESRPRIHVHAEIIEL
jgi:hypothetical protein